MKNLGKLGGYLFAFLAAGIYAVWCRRADDQDFQERFDEAYARKKKEEGAE